MTRLINVSNRLPVTVGDTINPSSGGLVAALEGLSGKDLALAWIGWPGSEIEESRRPAIERELAERYRCTPVFLSDDLASRFYEGFSNSSLWPLLHYMTSRFRYDGSWWSAYQEVNGRFAEKVLSIADEERDLVWVHDYQLMLVPGMLRQAMPRLRIGFFLHTPFPSFEVFRCHPDRSELAAGLLGADVLGFHTFGYLRHFKSTALRLLGVESETMRVRHEGRCTRLGVYPIGINAGKFTEQLDSPEFAEQLRQTRQAHAGRKVVLSVERTDYTKGLLHRLDAIDLFLERAKDREQVKFIMVSVPSRENVEEYKALLEELEAKVGRLNGKYATLHHSPIHFIHGSVNFTELCALYAVADVGLVTPLIDGMNLVAKEYIACQRDRAMENPGVLVLSEFAGAAEELFNAVIVNPYDAAEVADAITHALAMPLDERRRRIAAMRQRVLTANAGAWARTFIEDLAAVRPAHVEGNGEPCSIAEARQRIEAALRDRARKVAFFLDYDGTLREIERDPVAAVPSAAVRQTLERLQGVPGLDVTIISGRTSDDLERFLGTDPFGLIAEHGAALRRPGSAQWEQLDRNIDYAWKDEMMRVLHLYEQSTPGSFIENKRTSLVWHYRRADPEFGEWKAKQLAEELAVLTANQPLHVRHGRKIVEISPSVLNKGAAVMRMIETADYALVLVAGDDATDQSMYSLPGAAGAEDRLVSINVGERDARAQYRVGNPAAFRQFIEQVVSVRRPEQH